MRSTVVGEKSVTKLSVRAMVVGALIMGIVFVLIAGCGNAPPTDPSVTTIRRASPPIPAPAPTVAPGDEEKVTLVGTPLTVNLLDNGGAGPFGFEPLEFRFNRGEIVNFTFIADGAFHTFTVNDLEINVEVNAGESSGLDFEFTESGTYKLVCIPHEAQGMVGEIVVEDTPSS